MRLAATLQSILIVLATRASAVAQEVELYMRMWRVLRSVWQQFNKG